MHRRAGARDGAVGLYAPTAGGGCRAVTGREGSL